MPIKGLTIGKNLGLKIKRLFEVKVQSILIIIHAVHAISRPIKYDHAKFKLAVTAPVVSHIVFQHIA